MKRPSINDPLEMAASKKNAGIAPVEETPAEETPAEETKAEYMTSAVNLRISDWTFLRHVAEARSLRRRKQIGKGGRPSVSAVIQTLIDENRDKLKAELPPQK